MSEIFSRLEMLIGKEALKKLSDSKVAIFGIGGVGGYTAEALIRCGVGSFILIDNDTVSASNINRQIIADETTVGKYKTEVMRERMLKINSAAKIEEIRKFYLPGDNLDFLSGCDYVVDAIDTVSSKIELAVWCESMGLPLVSAMGAGNKLNPAMFEAADIYDTSVCPLCRVMRTNLRKRGVKSLRVVYSKEKPIAPICHSNVENDNKLSASHRPLPGSIQMAPAACGLIIAYEVVKNIIK
ncbi:MAG TPA: tRNA threonylcarbamoyladenosine dehydratase [Firmicutes bacterium]|nr:tRNA threonylcarbamoyladenosine dehydratase [Bacillota bacterium]